MPQEQLKKFAEKYTGRVAQLLSLGREPLMKEKMLDYVEAFGFTDEDVEQLLMLAKDLDIYLYDYSDIPEDEGLEFYGVIHAWYALSQMKVPEAKDIFIEFLETYEHDDWISESFRKLIEPYRQEMYDFIAERTKNKSLSPWVRWSYIDTVGDMLKAGEVEREKVDTLIIEILTTCDNEIAISATIGLCVDHQLVHHHELIKACFERGVVDPTMEGDLEDIEIELGLREDRETEREPNPFHSMWKGLEEEYGHKLENVVTMPYVRTEEKVGRNDPCPCGSGKKYKKCCINK